MTAVRESRTRIVEADLARQEDQDAVVAMTSAYATDPMGNAGPLPSDVLDRLIPALRTHPTTVIFLAWEGEEPIGIATCFLGFSTFYARPLLNVHDLAVVPQFRGRGVGRRLLEAVAAKGTSLGCCKVTLEVHEANTRAKQMYEAAGFAEGAARKPGSRWLFYSKTL